MFSEEVATSGIFRTVRELQPLRRLHVLLVDSDAASREKMQHDLDGGFVVQCAASLPEAWQSIESRCPDVLICEILLGQENGLDLCRAVRGTSSLSHLPIMLLTSLTTLQDKLSGFDAGADDYVVKPVDTRHLMARIRLLARIKRLERDDQGDLPWP